MNGKMPQTIYISQECQYMQWTGDNFNEMQDFLTAINAECVLSKCGQEDVVCIYPPSNYAFKGSIPTVAYMGFYVVYYIRLQAIEVLDEDEWQAMCTKMETK